MKTKSIKREDAEKRNSTRAALADKQQLEKLDIKYGEDLGAARERARLLKRIKEKDAKVKKEH